MRRALALLLVVALRGSAAACGPDFADMLPFAFAAEGDGRLACGRLGIVLPSFSNAELTLAWSRLAGAGERPEWRDAMAAARCTERNGPTAQERWLVVRRRVPHLESPYPIDVWRSMEVQDGDARIYQAWDNCLDDAFRTAAKTLKARARQLGDDSAAVRDWARAQDVVFGNCSSGGSVPEPVEPGLPALLAQDRAYQTAAAHFYATRWDAAEAGFRAVAADAASPWQGVARLLVLRTQVRRATLGQPDGGTSIPALREARAAIDAAIATEPLPHVRRAMRQLRAWVQARVDPAARLAEIATALLQPTPPAQPAALLTDAALVLYQNPALTPAEVAAPGDRLVAWLDVFGGMPRADAAVAAWRADPDPAWLVAALADTGSADSAAAEVLAASDRIAPDAAAYPTVAFHAARLELGAGRRDAARARLAPLLAGAGLDPSSTNLLRTLRAAAATDLHDFLVWGTAEPVLTMPEEYPDAPPPQREPRFPMEVASALTESTPLAMLAAAADDDVLPASLRGELALVVWTRAALLEAPAAHGDALARARAAAPELAAYFDAYAKAPDAPARRFAAAWLLLHAPGLRPWVTAGFLRPDRTSIDEFRDNWWCAPRPPDAEPSPVNDFYVIQRAARGMPDTLPPPALDFAAFLPDDARQAGRDEWTRIGALGPGPNVLGTWVLEWARSHPDDPRVPEALHLAVRATRYGCTDAGTGAVSKAAFQRLHGRYAKSPFAAQTPYWFQ
jgi:hypothetical protein